MSKIPIGQEGGQKQHQAATCSVCDDEVSAEHVDCPTCQAQYHPECWQLNDGCGKCGLSTSDKRMDPPDTGPIETARAAARSRFFILVLLMSSGIALIALDVHDIIDFRIPGYAGCSMGPTGAGIFLIVLAILRGWSSSRPER